jgi:hypothetical protein
MPCEAMAHSTKSNNFQDSCAIKCSSTFVNKYAWSDSDGRQFDSEIENPHFPVLWPYAKGLPEMDCPVDVLYNIHIQAAL